MKYHHRLIFTRSQQHVEEAASYLRTQGIIARQEEVSLGEGDGYPALVFTSHKQLSPETIGEIRKHCQVRSGELNKAIPGRRTWITESGGKILPLRKERT